MRLTSERRIANPPEKGNYPTADSSPWDCYLSCMIKLSELNAGVIGASSRKGNVVCKVIENTDARTLNGFVRKAVSDKVDLVVTDEHTGYNSLPAFGYPHETVAHSDNEYVRGNIIPTISKASGACSSGE